MHFCFVNAASSFTALCIVSTRFLWNVCVLFDICFICFSILSDIWFSMLSLSELTSCIIVLLSFLICACRGDTTASMDMVEPSLVDSMIVLKSTSETFVATSSCCCANACFRRKMSEPTLFLQLFSSNIWASILLTTLRRLSTSWQRTSTRLSWDDELRLRTRTSSASTHSWSRRASIAREAPVSLSSTIRSTLRFTLRASSFTDLPLERGRVVAWKAFMAAVWCGPKGILFSILWTTSSKTRLTLSGGGYITGLEYDLLVTCPRFDCISSYSEETLRKSLLDLSIIDASWCSQSTMLVYYFALLRYSLNFVQICYRCKLVLVYHRGSSGLPSVLFRTSAIFSQHRTDYT